MSLGTPNPHSSRLQFLTQNSRCQARKNFLARITNSCLIFFAQHVESRLVPRAAHQHDKVLARPKTFHHHLARVVPHSAKLSAKCAFPATSLACDNSCTTHVAVINSLLDNLKSSRSNPVCAKKFLREVFHAAKYFVLVCRLFYLLRFSSSRHPLPVNGRRSALIKRVENF